MDFIMAAGVRWTQGEWKSPDPPRSIAAELQDQGDGARVLRFPIAVRAYCILQTFFQMIITKSFHGLIMAAGVRWTQGNWKLPWYSSLQQARD